MKKTILSVFAILASLKMQAQTQNDSIKYSDIQEVIVIGTTNISNKESKPLSSIDEYLQKSPQVEMIRRGSYAWEPIINNMATERTLITIDGMRIFGACTDKMDPITSYVEISNLSSATVTSGEQGSCHGSSIGGSIDLARKHCGFGEKKWDFNINSGFESVNLQKIMGGGISFKTQNFYTDVDFMSRNADNYTAGNHIEIPFSQFHKINFSGISGVKFSENKLLEISVIYDKATDVGYPALPMDVSLAEAVIISLKFQYHPAQKKLKNWETKIYYNHITHRMDDTKRPAVPIHMDMPGWSTTYGYYSKLNFEFKNQNILLNINGFANKSLANMTMYPENPNENLMFMLTWPDVKTFYQGVFLEDVFALNRLSTLKISGSAGFHFNKIDSEFGLNSLQIFYPEMKPEKSRFLKSLGLNYDFSENAFEAGLGIGYSERAPSVSEAYGFYLFNSAEKYDYIGNPDLQNETALEANAYLGFKTKKYSAKITSSFFKISNFIVGKYHQEYAPMTIGANGVKLVSTLDFATIFNIALDSEIKLMEFLKYSLQITYSRGKDFENANLPYISPLSYRSALSFDKSNFTSEISIFGNGTQNDFSPDYGETRTPDFAILNASFGKKFVYENMKISLKIGVENIFDKYYTAYSDWNKIPRAGRNFFMNLGFEF
ncbi:MAG: TonB-dependent receptor plug domain-containing protein [Flavobacteriaceae bacterium]|jgi:iron complex outermembrane receptor protein|nr:TonB-dependent receptor plug domain-containing protein [Flavobacteriaceae bacterium]